MHPKLLSKLRIYAISQKLDYKFGEKDQVDQVCFDVIDKFYKYFTFLHAYIFCYWEKLPSHAWLERNCVYEAPPLFFFLKHYRLFVFVKNYY